ncbi:cation:proton antiporter [Streptomyces sp. 061-3]|uniref:cation:proton antiporter domain-containing protein n=1 Tax=Streptomyces sp. 061-3 TaxID=2789268 RepID=UPI003980AC35
MTTDQVLMGVGLTLVLAVGSQILAGRLRIPALIVLLPVGFAAGALVDELDPHRLLGPAFSPLVSLAVAVILYDAGLGLDLRKLKGHTRRVVIRLIWIGVLITWVLGTLLAMPLLGMDRRAAVMLGAILVVSGPTVVGPLLGFVRPKERPQHILAWEGSLIDPVGGILGALVFHLVEASTGRHPRRLGVVRPSRSRPLLVGGEPWVVDLGRALRAAGLQVLMWAGLEQQRERIGQAGLELAPGELLAAATGEGAELEGITAVFFLTAEDDFNALAATILRGSVEGSVHRVGSPRESVGVVAPFIGGEVLFGTELTGAALTRRHEDGASIVTRPADQAAPAGWDMLFLVRGDGRLDPVTEADRPLPGPGDLAVLLAPADHPAVPPAPGQS